MKNKKNLIIVVAACIALAAIIISFIAIKNSKKITENNKTIPTAKIGSELVLSDSEKPIISLIPRSDGHELKLKIENIPTNVTKIEYELIYSATDNGLTMEKGVGDTVKITSSSIEKDLLLGTASCTNGCKYKYDEGIDSGTLSLYLYTDDNQSTTYETPFILITSADIKKDGGFTLNTQDFSVKATTTAKSDYFVAIKNYPSYYSVFSNGIGTGKITAITPDSVSKTDMSLLVGNYQIN
jgi:hypothetical protein